MEAQGVIREYTGSNLLLSNFRPPSAGNECIVPDYLLSKFFLSQE